MINKSVIVVDNLSKKYFIGKRESYLTLYDKLASIKSLFVRKREIETEFWALKKISFEVNKGEVIGIIGSNGAGKSTLLKILSRITEPTEGRIILDGRVSSLLEVGTGFNPELTGRENIYLNGAILGMSRKEISKRFDEIVDFSGIEKFIDTPVKRYSSGMYVRLAFAVAAHLEPDILIVDEVLAVGDTEFQKKCLGKMNDVSKKDGRTVLFVSHNLTTIKTLCKKTILLKNGEICKIGTTDSVIKHYLSTIRVKTPQNNQAIKENNSKQFQVLSVNVTDKNDNQLQEFDCNYPIYINMESKLNQKIPGLFGSIFLEKNDGVTVLVSDSNDLKNDILDNKDPMKYKIRIEIPARLLGHGEYFLSVNFTSLREKHISFERLDRIISFRIYDYSSRRGNFRPGYFSTLLNWKVI